MTGLGFTGNLVAILVLLLVIGIAYSTLQSRLKQTAATRQRNRADKGKVKCYGYADYDGLEAARCRNKAGWVTPHGYFCDDHWEINSQRPNSKVRWAHELAWKLKGSDVWTT